MYTNIHKYEFNNFQGEEASLSLQFSNFGCSGSPVWNHPGFEHHFKCGARFVWTGGLAAKTGEGKIPEE